MASQCAACTDRLVEYDVPEDLSADGWMLGALQSRAGGPGGVEVTAFVLAKHNRLRAAATQLITESHAATTAAYRTTTAAAYRNARAYCGGASSSRGSQGPAAAVRAASAPALGAVDFRGIFAMRGRVVALGALAAEVAAVALGLRACRLKGLFGVHYGAPYVALRLARMAAVDVAVDETHTWADVLTRVGVARGVVFLAGGGVKADCARKEAALAKLMDHEHGAPPVSALLAEVNRRRNAVGKVRVTALDLSISECMG